MVVARRLPLQPPSQTDMHLPFVLLERVATFLDPQVDPYTHFFFTWVLDSCQNIPRSKRQRIPPGLIIFASQNGYINILEGWKHSLPSVDVSDVTRDFLFPSRFNFKLYTGSIYLHDCDVGDALAIACASNRVDVLDWWVRFYRAYGNFIKVHKSILLSCKRIDLTLLFSPERDMGLSTDQIREAAHSGSVDVLDWWMARQVRTNSHAVCSNHCIFTQYHSKAWPLNVLQWIDRIYGKRLKMECTTLTLENLCLQNRPAELEWWKQHYLHHSEPMFTCYISFLRLTARQGFVDVLRWWWEFGEQCKQPLRFDESIALIASAEGHESILDFILEHQPYAIRSSNNITNLASENGHVHILQWWASFCSNNDESLQYDHRAVDLASRNGHIEVLEWFAQYDASSRTFVSDDDDERLHAILYTSAAIDGASINGHIHVLNWWVHWVTSNRLSTDNVAPAPVFKWTNLAMDEASNNDRIDVLNWWVQQHHMSLIYTHVPIYVATMDCNLEILDWWRTSGLDLHLTEQNVWELKTVLAATHVEPEYSGALEWWLTHFPERFMPD